ncbi:MAG: Lysophospholipase 1 [Alyxoria varia]|nr:MAG: Lysophospholipase 1 [Alyxoria varia]
MATDVRSMLQAERSSRRLKHPYAAYHHTGQLICKLCDANIKSDSSWESHLRSETHVSLLKEAQRSQVSNRKRKFDDSEEHDRKRPRNVQTAENIPNPTKDIPKSPLTRPEDQIHTALAERETSDGGDQQTEGEVGVDHDEWTAFERDMGELDQVTDQEGPRTAYKAAPSISAAPVSAAELASQAREEQSRQRGQKDREIEEERDDAAQQAEEELNRMAQLDDRMATLRKRQDSLRRAAQAHDAQGASDKFVESENAGLEDDRGGIQAGTSEDEDDEDDFDEWQGLGGGTVSVGAPAAPDGYNPARTRCPSTRPSIRDASSLSREETSWLRSRRSNTVDPMRDFLKRANIQGFDAEAYISRHSRNTSALPNIGMAFSGGGYRALMNGAGALAAFDSRTPNSTSAGHLGGLLQSSTYITGLSGGSWLVGSIYANNFTSVQDIIDAHGPTWDFSATLLAPPPGSDFDSTRSYWRTIEDQVQQKSSAPMGSDTTITDFWGRALSYQLINASDGGAGYTMSSLATQKFLSDGDAPLPIIVADEREPGEILISSNTSVFEFSPWEMGTWDPTVYGFAPIQYVGSSFDGGELADDADCIAGFDNMGFIMGTSSTLFNQVVLQINQTVDLPSFISNIVNDLFTKFAKDTDEDIAEWTPNPFYRYHGRTNANARSKNLTLVDGGEDFQNIPLHPLIQPVRDVDVIFAVDSSADTSNSWPNGTALVATYERSLNPSIQNGTRFPSIPTQQTFINLGLNSAPTFFGCNASNFTNTRNSAPPPLIVYIPNSPYVFFSNLSTFDPKYEVAERNAVIHNGYDVATRANSSFDSQWPTCVGCAVLARSLERTNTEIPASCRSCFEKYCWDGTIDNSKKDYAPSPRLTTIRTSASTASTSMAPPAKSGVFIVTIVAISLWIAM